MTIGWAIVGTTVLSGLGLFSFMAIAFAAGPLGRKEELASLIWFANLSLFGVPLTCGGAVAFYWYAYFAGRELSQLWPGAIPIIWLAVFAAWYSAKV